MGTTYKDVSKVSWESADSKHHTNPTVEQLQVGCHQRIADATETMAQNHVKLQNERDQYKRWYENERLETKRLARSNNALHGVINRMKKQKP